VTLCYMLVYLIKRLNTFVTGCRIRFKNHKLESGFMCIDVQGSGEGLGFCELFKFCCNLCLFNCICS